MDEATPAFDVFTLGKVLWAMIAGKQFLRLWCYESPEFNLELIFSKDPTMRWANRLFKTCIVEHENSCLKNANELLAIIDETTHAIERGGQLFGKNEDRIECRMCGIGYCTVRIPFGHEDMKLYCNNCGYEYSFRGVKEKPAWIL